MPCHILKSGPSSPESLCGVDFSSLEEPHPHSYVEKRLDMADCPECLRLWHESELERLKKEAPWSPV